MVISRFEQLKDEHCKLCGSPSGWGNQRLLIHHIDHNHYNDIPSNRLIVCRKCHTRLHFENSWYIDSAKHMREQGFTLQAIADTFGVTRQRIHQLLKQDNLAEIRLRRELGKEIKTLIAKQKTPYPPKVLH